MDSLQETQAKEALWTDLNTLSKDLPLEYMLGGARPRTSPGNN